MSASRPSSSGSTRKSSGWSPTKKLLARARGYAPLPIRHGSANEPNFEEIVYQGVRDRLWLLPACADKAKKHPAIKWKEYQTRRPTESEILGWIAQYPDRNGCLLTNSVLGRFVLDCDSKAALAWARRKGIPFTQTMQTKNGLHFHFVYPDLRVPTIAGEIHKHVDLRGAGGIAMAAGSVHWTGYRYRWQPGHSPQEAPLALAPEWLLDWLREREARRQQAVANIIIEAQPFNGQVSPYAAAIIDRELAALRETLQGARNDKLRDVAFNFGRLAAGGMADGDDLLMEVCTVAAHWPNQKRSLDTIERSFKAGMEHPRVAPPSFGDQLIQLRGV